MRYIIFYDDLNIKEWRSLVSRGEIINMKISILLGAAAVLGDTSPWWLRNNPDLRYSKANGLNLANNI